jgi:hypothetical protein
MNTGKSYTQNALELFQSNVGKIVTSEQLAKLPGKSGFPISHNMRRIFELRDEKGYKIVNHQDNDKTGLNLKVNEWVLLDKKPDPHFVKNRGVNKRIRFDVFERDNYTCQICGRTPADENPIYPEKMIKLHVGHILAHKGTASKKETLDTADFITMCSVCNEGAKNKNITVVTLLDRVKKSDIDTKKEIFEYLRTLFT